MSEPKGLVTVSNSLLVDSGSSLNILLVDVDEEYGNYLREMLAFRPGEVFTLRQAHDLSSAISILEQQGHAAADVILLDLDLPDTQGLDAAIMVLQAAEDIPVIVLAGTGNEQIAWQSTKYGAQTVLSRDTHSPESLIWAINHAIEQHMMRSALEKHVRDLEVSNGRFLSLVVDNADAILVVDGVGIVRFVNPSAEALLNCSASKLLGQMFGIPLEGIDTTEIDLCSRPHRNRTAEIRVMRTLWDGERAFIVTMRDITERKKSETTLRLAKQTAEQASAMKSQFLANMSHELRTPLNAIIGYSEMMMMNIAGEVQPTVYGNYIKDIHSGGKHLLSLINDLLDLSKAESGKLQLMEERFDIVELCERVVDLLIGQATTKGVSLNLRPESRSIWVTADERMMKQVLLNLVSNSVKFTPAGGNVTVAVSRGQQGNVRLVVRDTGIGIPKDQIPRAFAGFVQIENAYQKTDNTGTGLGLALTKRYVEMHQGKISLDSDIDAGTTATVILPRTRTVTRAGEEQEKVVSITSTPVARAADAS